MNTDIVSFQTSLNENNASGGCHGFLKEWIVLHNSKSGRIVYLCESEATATITPRRNWL